MYIPFATLSILSILHSLALADPHHRHIHLTGRQAAGTNSPSAPGFMTDSNQTVHAYTRSQCGNNVNGDENIWFSEVLYGKDNHALVVSFELSRDMADDEVLDMSFANPDGSVPSSEAGTDMVCALFQYTASPDGKTGQPLKGNQCYTPSVPVTCFNLWKKS